MLRKQTDQFRRLVLYRQIFIRYADAAVRKRMAKAYALHPCGLFQREVCVICFHWSEDAPLFDTACLTSMTADASTFPLPSCMTYTDSPPEAAKLRPY